MLTRKPRKGDRLICGKGRTYTVTEMSGRIAWILEDGKQNATCFIWGFVSDGRGPVTDNAAVICEEDGRPVYPNQYMSEL